MNSRRLHHTLDRRLSQTPNHGCNSCCQHQLRRKHSWRQHVQPLFWALLLVWNLAACQVCCGPRRLSSKWTVRPMPQQVQRSLPLLLHLRLSDAHTRVGLPGQADDLGARAGILAVPSPVVARLESVSHMEVASGVASRVVRDQRSAQPNAAFATAAAVAANSTGAREVHGALQIFV